MATSFAADSPPSPIEHVRGLEALPLVVRALNRYEPAVLVTVDGLGAIYAPPPPLEPNGDDPTLWLMADARTLLDWDAYRRQIVSLSFQSADERVYLTISGRTTVIPDPAEASRLWRPSFTRWFQRGPADPRLLLVQLAAYDVDFYQTPSGRVIAHVAH